MRIVVLLVLLAALPARAADRAAALAAAGRDLADGKYAQVEAATRPLVADLTLLRADRAEALRLHGLALYFQGKEVEAEASLRQFLTLEPDAHLDPALYPPECVVFFEAVRARHRGAISKARPPAKRRRSHMLNLVPPLGQVQNGDTAKAWVIGSAGVALLGVNIATYAMLSASCSAGDLTCDRDASSARALRAVNLVSGGLFLAVYAYGVIDGYVMYNRNSDRERERSIRAAIVPTDGGLLIGGSGTF